MELFTTVKRESDRELCDGCLSNDRLLKHVKDTSGLMEHIFTKPNAIDLKSILLCWECQAAVKKMCRFRDQVHYAQTILQQTHYQNDHTIRCLSKFNVTALDSVDIKPTIEEKVLPYPTNEFIDQTPPSEINMITLPVELDNIERKDVKIPKEEVYIPEDDDFDYEVPLDQMDEDPKIEPKQEVKKEKKRVKKIKPKHDIKTESAPVKKHPLAGVKKYTGRAKMSKNPNIDLVNYENNFILTAMTDNEIERLGKPLVDVKKRGIKPICKICQKLFISAIDSKRHKTFCHILKEDVLSAGPFSCLECRTECPDKDSLRDHWSNIHNSTFRCKFCATKVTHAFEYKLHSEQHKNLLTCKDCKLWFKVTFDNNKDFGYHFKTLHRRLLCDYCGKESYTTGALAKHIRKHHSPLICTICDRTFDKYVAFQRHNISYHPELVEREETDESRYCVECDKHYPSVERYQRHLRATTVHNPTVVKQWRNKIVHCPECGKQFKRNKVMTNHYKLYHERKTDHYCSICDKYLVSAYRLRTHVASVHLKIRPPKDKYCEICGRGFGTNAILKNHMRTHTGERPFKCTLCPAAFTQSHPLKSHLKSQHNKHPPEVYKVF